MARLDDFGLDEQVAKRGLVGIGRGRCKYYFCITGYLENAPHARAVGQAQTPQLDIVLRRDHDFQMRFNVAVASPVFGTTFTEQRFIGRRAFERRLVRSGPVFSGLYIAQIDEAAPIVARHVFAPAGNGHILPAAVATTGIGQHHMITTV